ncbi:MAG: stage II sporulation protein D, partial [Luteibaculaceae bacterium]
AAKEWEKYITERSKIPNQDTSQIYNFKQPTRSTYFLDFEEGIPLKTIRKDWRLKSTYFDLEHSNEDIYFLGRGFGHGVGMCQEGAMQMARNQKKYHEIIHHYYNRSYIIDKKWLPVLRSKL